MLKGRFLIRYYLIASYIGATIGLVITSQLDNGTNFGIALLAFIAGIVLFTADYRRQFYISLGLNGLATGALMTYVFRYFFYDPSIVDIILANFVLVGIFVLLALVSSLTWKNNAGFSISVVATIIVFFVILWLRSNVPHEVFNVMAMMQYIGMIFMIALFITGVYTENLMKNCTIASFAIVAIALVAAALVALAYLSKGGDLDLKGKGRKASGGSKSKGLLAAGAASSSSKSKSSGGFSKYLGGLGRSRTPHMNAVYFTRRPSHIWGHHYYLYDAWYFESRRKRNDHYVEKYNVVHGKEAKDHCQWKLTEDPDFQRYHLTLDYLGEQYLSYCDTTPDFETIYIRKDELNLPYDREEDMVAVLNDWLEYSNINYMYV